MSEEVVIWWRLCRAEEQPSLVLGEPPSGFLSEHERQVFDGLLIPKRRQEWLLGRKVAKDLCRARLAAKGREVPAAAITVAAAEDGAPRVLLEREGPLPVTVSISHRAGLALCALVELPDAPMGADLELCEPRPAGFAADFFTAAEVRSLPENPDQERWRAIAEIWSLKESALKAVRLGLRADTRSVGVGARGEAEAGWSGATLELQLPDGPELATGLARWDGPHVVTLAWLGEGKAVPRPVH